MECASSYIRMRRENNEVPTSCDSVRTKILGLRGLYLQCTSSTGLDNLALNFGLPGISGCNEAYVMSQYHPWTTHLPTLFWLLKWHACLFSSMCVRARANVCASV